MLLFWCLALPATEMAEVEGTDMSKIPMVWMEASPVAAAALEALGKKARHRPWQNEQDNGLYDDPHHAA